MAEETYKKIVVDAEIKRIISEKGLNRQEDLVLGLDRKVRELLEQAMKRAQYNGRKTVMVRDL